MTLDSFIKKPDLINSEYLKELIILIQEDLKKEIYYKIPFLIGPNIIKLYIESDLDEKETQKTQYYEVFENLKKYYFINRNYLNPIYEYFSDIFYNIKNLKNNDKKLAKFQKVQRLWKIFYTNALNSELTKAISW